MTDVRAPSIRGLLTITDILSGRACRVITWQDWAHLCNWIVGRGGHIAGAHAPAVNLTSGSLYQTHLLTRGAYPGIQRMWTFWIRGDSETSVVDISIEGGTASTFAIPLGRDAARPLVVFADVNSQSAAAEDLRYDIDVTGAGDVWLDAVSAIEMPRAILDSATAELGTMLSPYSAGQPIRNLDFANGAEILTGNEHGRRHLFSWGVPHLVDAGADTSFAWTTASGSLTEIFALHPPLLARKGVPGETKRDVRFRYTAHVTTGVTAEVYVGTTSRAPTLAHTITSTSFATYSVLQEVDVEDTSGASGLQGGTFDGLRMQAKITAGVGNVYLFTIDGYED